MHIHMHMHMHMYTSGLHVHHVGASACFGHARVRLRARSSFPPLLPRRCLPPPAAAPAASAPPAPAPAAACADPAPAAGRSHWRTGGGPGERDGAARRRALRGGVRASGAMAAPVSGASCGLVASECPPQHPLPTLTWLQPSAMSHAASALVGVGSGIDSRTGRYCGGGWQCASGPVPDAATAPC